MCVCCSFEHFVIATGVSYISAGFSNKKYLVGRLVSATREVPTTPLSPPPTMGSRVRSPSRPPTSVLFGEPRHSPNRYQDVRLHTTSASELPVMGPPRYLPRLRENEAPPRRSYTFGFPHCNPCEPCHSKNTTPYQLRNTDASSLTFRKTHRTLCQIGLLVGTISGTEALMPH